MVGLKLSRKQAKPIAAPASDYGSDFDEETVNELLSQAAEHPGQPRPLLDKDFEQDPVLQDAPPALQRTVLLDRSVEQSNPTTPCAPDTPSSNSRRGPQIEIEYSEVNRSAFSRTCIKRSLPLAIADAADTQRLKAEPTTPKSATGEKRDAAVAASTAPEQPGEDPRAPLERFRKKKPLSVTDLVSPAWCEQQYWYSLTRFGRVRRTKAMKQGSSVHKVLEEQVHKEVTIDVQTREDMFGLRIWNVIQGLRTLRATGMTREMEVWGVLNGEVVNGIIDEINTVCPDEEAEEKMLEREEEKKTGTKKDKPLEAGQKTLTGFLSGSQNDRILEEHFKSTPSSSHEEEAPPTFYISDIKTRQSKSLPPDGSPSRPVYMQLMLYRRLFASLAANETPADRIFQRYNLDPQATFSDTFIAEVSQLDFNFPDNVSNSEEGEVLLESSHDSLSELLAHNSLPSLWSFMMAEFARTVPMPVPPSLNVRSSISKLLVAEYRSGSSGDLLGKKSFVHDDAVLDAYANDEISWWRGERPTKGVDIEDASKCRICDFAEGCTWRAEKIEEATKKARLRRGPKKSEV
jgi:exonuclease V